ncbi:unnamed protein product [Schistosoma mattheei]|uniref:Uncharacterized protein n=1 Tax=Schistosoma mattheei TaxID=31246 RepID=A0AA85BNB9_9TREM|nr:unnamed protein product [Schistosoma mattheei]
MIIKYYIIYLFIINDILLILNNFIYVYSINNQLLNEKSMKKSIINHTMIINNHNYNGYWFNKGIEYHLCTQSIIKNYNYLLFIKNQYKDCDKLSIQLLINNQIDLISKHNNQLNYELLMKKIICILQKINCPINEKSFQIHDIPCQSSCLSLLSICGQLHKTPQSFFMNIPSSCPNNNLIQTSHKRWIYENNNHYQTTLSPIQSTTSYTTYHHMPNSKQYTKYPNYRTYLSSRSFLLDDHYEYDQMKSNYHHNNHRYPRQINMNNNDNQYDSEQSKQSMEYLNHYHLKNLHIPFTPTQRKLLLTKEDCLLLPPGGCDNWIDPSTNLQRLKASNYKEYLKLNLGCPKDIPEICNEMFPTLYTRSKWIKSNFTVSAIIRISGTLWWFGKNDHYQPLFRFHILKTFDSDIHPYDEKMILTYSWPLKCICIDEIIIGKKYLMLTHSFKSRQTLHITKNTVFLSRVRRYTRKLASVKEVNCIKV